MGPVVSGRRESIDSAERLTRGVGASASWARATVRCGETGRWGRGVRERGGARGLDGLLGGFWPSWAGWQIFLFKTFF